MNTQKIEVAVSDFLGSKQQCLDESNIIKDQRDNKENLNRDENFDDGDDRALVITTILTEPTQTKLDQYGNGLQVTHSPVSIDSIQVRSNFYSSSPTSSPIIESSISHSMALFPNQNATLTTSSLTPSIDSAATLPESPPPPPPPINSNAITTTPNLQGGRMDALSDLTSKLAEVTKSRDKWKNKFVSLQKQYFDLNNVTMCEL
jgi:hypothetical protein